MILCRLSPGFFSFWKGQQIGKLLYLLLDAGTFRKLGMMQGTIETFRNLKPKATTSNISCMLI
jgi:hypothetical protein